jgi:hypothetical protein
MLVASSLTAFCEVEVNIESFKDHVQRQIREIEKELLRQPFRVAVLGPGRSSDRFQKRQQILDALKNIHCDAFMPEDFIDKHSLIPEDEQERLILSNSDVDFIIALNMSEGPLAELAVYSNNSAIVQKTFVLLPEQFSSSGTFPSLILDRYPMRWPYDDHEFRECELVGECISRAKIWRWRRTRPGPSQF